MKYAKQAPDRVVLKSDKNKAESIAHVISVDSPLLDTFVALSSVDTFVLFSLVDIPVDLSPGG